jgi:serine/threonine protein kinase
MINNLLNTLKVVTRKFLGIESSQGSELRRDSYKCLYCGEWHEFSISTCPSVGKKVETYMKYIGRVVKGKYRIIRMIGEGGAGVVFEAEHTGLEKRFAIKFLYPTLSMDSEMLIRFMREAKAASKVEHENVCSYIDIDEDEYKTPYIVMELLQGESLMEYLSRRGKLPADEAVAIMVQVLSALSVAHKVGIIHRDLKPANIFLVKSEGNIARAKILDFGLAKFREGTQTSSLTQHGAIIGTPYYMSPEQITEGKEIDHRVDIYACGVILYQLLTGKLPYESNSLSGLLYKIANTEPVDMSKIDDSIPVELVKAVNKAMQKNPDDRFKTANEMREVLMPFGGSLIKTIKISDRDGGLDRESNVKYTEVNLDTYKSAKVPKRYLSLFVFILLLGILSLLVLYLKREKIDSLPSYSSEPKIGIKEEPIKESQIKKEEEIKVSISVIPKEAIIFLDGVKLQNNPSEFVTLKDGSLHKIEAKLEGYTDYQEFVNFDKDISIKIVLPKTSERQKGEKANKKSSTTKKSRVRFIEKNPYK